MSLEVSSLTALHIHHISKSLPFALLTVTLICHKIWPWRISSLLSFLLQMHHFSTSQGQFNQLGNSKEIPYHFAQIPTPLTFCLFRQAVVTHIISDFYDTLQNLSYCNNRKNISYPVMIDEGSEKKELMLNFEKNTYLIHHQNQVRLGEFATIVIGICEVSNYGTQPRFQEPFSKTQTLHFQLLEV